MLQVTDPTLKRLLLGQIVEAIEVGGMDDLLRRGFRPEFLDALRHRKARDLIELARQDAVRFAVAIDQDAMLAALKRLDWRRRDGMLYEYFVAHGATVQLVCTLFRKSADEVRGLRALMLPEKALKGRSRMPAPAVRDRIHARWHAIHAQNAAASLRERFYALHQSFPDCGIDALQKTLNEFTAQPDAASAAHARQRSRETSS